eukprot:Platyproteum_vivax@DN5499_c0_g1_i1.p1
MAVNITVTDIILFLAVSYASVETGIEWHKFDGCKHPIQLWQLVSYLIIVLFRLSHFLGQALSRDGEDFLLYHQPGPPRWVSFMILGMLFPAFVAWTVVGTVWLAEIQQSTPHCLPRSIHPWFLLMWLFLCYIWIAIYCLFISIALLFEMRAHQARINLRFLEDDEILRRWGQMRILADYGIHIIRRGLPIEQIRALPTIKISLENKKRFDEQSPCSICIENMEEGDEVRLLYCNHAFHRGCIDVWLLRNATCPNCKTVLGRGECAHDCV